MVINTKNIANHIVIFLLLATSGIPFFRGQEFLIVAFIFAAYLYIIRKRRPSIYSFLIIAIFLIVELLQSAYFPSIGLEHILKTLFRVGMVYLLITAVGTSFVDKYIKQVYYLSVISLLLYPLLYFPSIIDFLLVNITPIFDAPFEDPDSFYQASPNVLIWTIEPLHASEFRNSGPFWEPGGFAVFILIALLFQLQRDDLTINRFTIVFIISLLTTLSTMAYLGLLIIAYMLIIKNRPLVYKIFAVPICLIVGIVLILQIEILGDKIQTNFEMAELTTSSRFGSALADYNQFKEQPLIGWGRGQNRFGIDNPLEFGQEHHRNNGLTNIYTTYGVFLGTLFFFWYFYGFKNYRHFNNLDTNLTYYFLLIMAICSFSQVLFFRPFILSLIFLPEVYRNVDSNS